MEKIEKHCKGCKKRMSKVYRCNDVLVGWFCHIYGLKVRNPIKAMRMYAQKMGINIDK